MRTRRPAQQAQINCPIDLFLRQEAEIARLTEAINAARTAEAKAPAAEALLEAVNVLLACEVYDEARLDCRLCRNFSQLRAKTANLILKAGRLSH
jgi:hypothetical protein